MSSKSSNRFSKPDAKAAKGQEKRAWLGFVDIALTDEQRAIVAESVFGDEGALSFLQEMTEDGYKISVVEDPAHNCYVATATGSHPQNINCGYSLTARGPNVVGCLASLAYKHIALCDGGIWTNFSNSTTKSSWG